MKRTQPKAQLLPTLDTPKSIERAARNCTLSYDKMEPGSDRNITTNLIKRNHLAMLEFGNNLVFTVPQDLIFETTYISDLTNFLFITGFNRFVNYTNTNRRVFSINPRTAYQIYLNHEVGFHNSIVVEALKRLIYEKYECFNLSKKDLKTTYSPYNILGEVVPESREEKLKHLTQEVEISCSRSTLAQLTRHRLASYAVNSMRYIDWTNEKHGGELTFIEPIKVSTDSEYEDLWVENRIKSESDYFRLKQTMTAQEARSEVYQDIKTDIIVKATLEEWNVIFEERCSMAADPEIRKIMIPLREEFKKKYSTIF